MLYTTSDNAYHLFVTCMSYDYECHQAKECGGATSHRRYHYYKKHYFYVMNDFYKLSFVENIINRATKLY